MGGREPLDAGAPPLVLHVVHRFATGGMENGLVKLLNHLPAQEFRHAVLALTEVDPGFAARVHRDGVQFISLRKPPGQLVKLYPALYRLFRSLRPAILHTRNLGTLECHLPAALAGVPHRLHGEHGRDLSDPDGRKRRYQWLRRLHRPLVHRWVALSDELQTYLTDRVGVPAQAVAKIYNGVDTATFAPRQPGAPRPPIAGCPFDAPEQLLIGTVGRMSPEKDQLLLARAFIALLQAQPAWRHSLRLVLVGDGATRGAIQAALDAAGMADCAWLPGMRQDVHEVMRGLDLFVLPSLAEGISNTILEAMATALPVLATRVGGNAELVRQDVTGWLVPAGDVDAMAAALAHAVSDRARLVRFGQNGRQRACQEFGLESMVSTYRALYRARLDKLPG